ncbi:MAG: protein-L-isoaspartate O-methyltransferase [archaeon]|nr:protein-L-isoaspartate O-methyltransferase [archaeon]
MTDDIFAMKRKQLVQQLIATNVIQSSSIEKAFLSVKREIFFPENLKQFAYVDEAFPIGLNQTISQPSTIAHMLELLNAKENQTVLEVGSGCGYVLALLSHIVGVKGKVIGTEILKELAEQSKTNLELADCKNVEVFVEDGAKFAEGKEFDRILLSCACPFIPKPCFQALKEKAIAVAPVGDYHTQQLLQLTKFQGKAVKKFAEGFYQFVPLRGEFGFK